MIRTPSSLAFVFLFLFAGCGPELDAEVHETPDELATSEGELSSTLLIATLNIQQGRDANGQPALARQIACLKAAKPDIVLLQESALPGDSRGAWTGQSYGTNNATRIAAELGMKFNFTTETADRMMTDGSGRLHYGVAILWKPALPLKARSIYAPARNLRNGVQWVDVPVAGKWFRLFNGHIHTTSPNYEEAKAIQGAAPDPSRTLVMGDLNGHDGQIGGIVMGPGHFVTHAYGTGALRTDALVHGFNVKVGSVYKICTGGVTDHPWGLAARVGM